ncbi:phage tail tube protein [Streptomyces cinereoruber]
MPELTTQKRFMRRGVSKFFFLTTIANPKNGPTRAEIAAGTELSDRISDVEGWALENTPIDTPDMGTDYTSSIPGEDKAENSALTFYEDREDSSVETLLSKGVEGYVVILRKGDIPASPSMDTFPVRVGARSASYTTAAEPAKFRVSFNITSKPALDSAIPALTAPGGGA